MLESYGPPTPPVFSRSRLALEIAAELVGTDGWPYLRAHIDLRQSDFDEAGFGLFGSGSLGGDRRGRPGQGRSRDESTRRRC